MNQDLARFHTFMNNPCDMKYFDKNFLTMGPCHLPGHAIIERAPPDALQSVNSVIFS
jgi:hypothetical protein